MIVDSIYDVIPSRQAARFWSKAEESDSGCWEWRGYCQPNGYGSWNATRKKWYAHRLSYELVKGAIGDKSVLHKCDNRKCVNPHHLFLGTQMDNMRDKVTKNRQQKGESVHLAKVTEAGVREIKLRYRNGETQSKIGAAYGLTQSAISFIVNGKNWKHIE